MFFKTKTKSKFSISYNGHRELVKTKSVEDVSELLNLCRTLRQLEIESDAGELCLYADGKVKDLETKIKDILSSQKLEIKRKIENKF